MKTKEQTKHMKKTIILLFFTINIISCIFNETKNNTSRLILGQWQLVNQIEEKIQLKKYNSKNIQETIAYKKYLQDTVYTYNVLDNCYFSSKTPYTIEQETIKLNILGSDFSEKVIKIDNNTMETQAVLTKIIIDTVPNPIPDITNDTLNDKYLITSTFQRMAEEIPVSTFPDSVCNFNKINSVNIF